MKPTIIIPSMNQVLCEKARAFIPADWPVIVKDGHPGRHFDELRALNIATKWAINLDEDCFLIDPSGVLRLIATMERAGFHTAGIQDGSSNLRFHNPVMFNPFFFVFDVAAVQAAPRSSVDVAQESQRCAQLQRYSHLPFAYDNFEVYYPFFMDLLTAGLKPLFLSNHAYEDYDPGGYDIGKPTIVLGEDGEELVIHAWWSRLYHEPVIRERISACEEYALRRSADRIRMGATSTKPEDGGSDS